MTFKMITKIYEILIIKTLKILIMTLIKMNNIMLEFQFDVFRCGKNIIV